MDKPIFKSHFGIGGLRPIKYTRRASHNSYPSGIGGLRPIKYKGVDNHDF